MSRDPRRNFFACPFTLCTRSSESSLSMPVILGYVCCNYFTKSSKKVLLNVNLDYRPVLWIYLYFPGWRQLPMGSRAIPVAQSIGFGLPKVLAHVVFNFEKSTTSLACAAKRETVHTIVGSRPRGLAALLGSQWHQQWHGCQYVDLRLSYVSR